MEVAASVGEPTMTKTHPPLDDEEEDKVGPLERKTRSFRRGNATGSTDSSTITITSGLSSSSSSVSDSADSLFTEEPITKELKVDQTARGGEVAAESSEAPELSQEETDGGFHGEHHDEKNGSVYFDREEGSESNGVNGAEPDIPESPTDENLNGERNQPDIQNVSTAEDNGQVPEIEEIGMNGSPEEPNAVHQLDAEVIEEDVDTEVVEDYDVEKVLENQESHDLYCPNCHSCITKRVVVKRRKRKIRHVLGDSKREKLDIPISVPTESDTVGMFSSDSTQVASRGQEFDRGQYWFRCLSCFSIFLPTGKGFKLFRFPRDVKKIETPLISQQTATVKKNWFSIFGFNKTPVEQGGTGGTMSSGSQVNPPDKLNSSLENVTHSNANDPSKAQVLVQDGATTLIQGGAVSNGSQVNPQDNLNSSVENVIPSNANDPSKARVPDQDSATTLIQGTFSCITELSDIVTVFPATTDTEKPEMKDDERVVDTESHDASKSFVNTVETVEEGPKYLVSSAIVSSLVEQSQPQLNKDAYGTDGEQPSKKESLLPIQTSYDIKVVKKVTDGSREVRIDSELPKKGAPPPLEEPAVSVTTKLDSDVTNVTDGKLVVVVDPVNVGPKPSQSVPSDVPTESDSLLQGTTQTQARDTGGAEAGEGRKLEILKSVVYGGLIESITSLGVISSAAGSGASTLNILVLGLANLIGGLILIAHNLQELRDGNPGRTATDENQINEQQEDRYQRLLGRRENFRLHAFVAILSFITFGLIPPVVYGFSFQKTDNRDYKAAVVLAVSLICIILLAIGKARAQTPRGSYLKTAMYYATIAVTASGISYFVGGIVSDLLEKYGWSDGSTSPAEVMLPLLGRKAGFGYSSY